MSISSCKPLIEGAGDQIQFLGHLGRNLIRLHLGGRQEIIVFEELKPGPIRHKEGLSPLMTKLERAVYAKVGHFIYPTFEQWKLAAMRDMRPWREILRWETIARAFDDYLALHPEATDNAKIVGTLAVISTGTKLKSKAKTDKELRELYEEAWRRVWLPLVAEPVEFPPGQGALMDYESIVHEENGLPYPNLFGDFDPRQILLAADLILGMNSKSGLVFDIYGENPFDADGKVRVGPKTVIVRLDVENEEAQELAKMCYVVGRMKGVQDFE